MSRQSLHTETFASFVAALAEGKVPSNTPHHLDASELSDGRSISLPVMLMAQPTGDQRGRTVVFYFHGAISRAKRQIPAFYGVHAAKRLQNADAIVLSLADPSLALSPDLRMAWYSSSRYYDTRARLRSLFREVATVLAPRRIIFVGGSVGGHPALLHSFEYPGSLCIAINPIVRISRYYPGPIRAYLNTCWGEGQTLDDLRDSVLDDVGTLYASGHQNEVILMQNATDHHIVKQALSFASKIKNLDQFLLLTHFFPETIGHSYPGAPVADMVKAAVWAPTSACRDVARELEMPSRRKMRSAGPDAAAAAGNSGRDVASLLAAAVLKR